MVSFAASRWLIALALVTAAPDLAQSVKPLTEFVDWTDSPALSPDGKTLAFQWTKPDYSSWIFLRPIGGGQPISFAGSDDKDGSPARPKWSPDGREIAFLRYYCSQCNSHLFVKNVPRGAERALGEVCMSPSAWTPDGRFLIASAPGSLGNTDCHITVIPVDGSSRINLVGTEGSIIALSPDGKRLVYAARNQLKLANLTGDFRLAGTPITIANEPHAIATISWVPSGHELVYQVWSDGILYSKLISAEGAPSSEQLVNTGGNIDISQILADGSGLGTEQSGKSALWRIDLRSARREPEKIQLIPWADRLLHVSPDGRSLAFATNRNGATQVWVSRLDGSQPRTLVSSIPPFGSYGDSTSVAGISWSPDGKWIALLTGPGVGHGVDDARQFLVPTVGGRLRVLVELCSQVRDSTPWSADSQSVFISKEDAQYKASYFQVDISSGTQTPVQKLPVSPRDLTPLPTDAEQPHLAQDGRFLYFEQRESNKSRLVIVRDLLPTRP